MSDQAPEQHTDEQQVDEQQVDATADEQPTGGESTDTEEAPAAPATLDRPLRSGDIVTGTVVRLTDFGAFVDVPSGPESTVTGLVHISEVAAGFVDNIYAHVGEGQQVVVKVLSIGDDGKVGLSMKQADPDWEEQAEVERPRRSTIDKDFDRRLRKFMHGSQSIQGEIRRQRRSRLGRDR